MPHFNSALVRRSQSRERSLSPWHGISHARTPCLLLAMLVWLGGCAGLGGSGDEPSQQAANEREGYQYAETAYLAGDYPEALRILRPLADQGDAEAQYVLGYMYYYGQGVASDPKVAQDWIRRAADQGHEKAAIAMSRFAAVQVDGSDEQPVGQNAAGQAPAASGPAASPREASPAVAREKAPATAPVTRPTPAPSPQPIAVRPEAREESAPMMEAKPAIAFGSYQWVKAQSPVHYTVQLLATNQRAAAEKFIDVHDISDKATIFQFRRNGKTWFSVIHGVYTSRELASAAVAAMPAELRRQSPWIREFSGIQDIIESPTP